MSLVAPCIAVRNILRSSLTNFYDQTAAELANSNDLTGQVRRRKALVKIMPDERPAPNAGREFISIYASGWEIIDNQTYGFHERVTVTVALTHRYGDVPYDRLGEAAYMADEDVFIQQYKTISDRLREIVLLIHGDFTLYEAQMTALLSVDVSSVAKALQSNYDKLYFTGADAKPKIVGPDHFFATSSDKSPSGLLMRANFQGSSRLHWMTTLDQHAV